MTTTLSADFATDDRPGNMPADIPAEIVRKVAEALEVALDAAYDSSIYRWPQQEDIPPIAEAVLAVAEPLIREQVAAAILMEVPSPGANTHSADCWRWHAVCATHRAAKIARGGQ